MGLGKFIRSLWPRRPASPRPMAHEEFAEAAALRVRRLAGAACVEVTGHLQLRVQHEGSGERRVFLDNAYQMYLRAEPGERDDVLDRFARSYAEAGEAMKATRDAIVPVIKDGQWLEDIRRSLRERGEAEGPEIVHEALGDELTIVYAVDTPSNIAYLTPVQLEELGLGRSELRRLAVRNLRGLLPRIEVHRGPLMSMVTADGNYEASLLLFDDLWERERSRMNGDPVVAVPARDLLVFTDSSRPEGIAELRGMVEKLREEAAYALTDCLFVWRDGALRRLAEEAASL